MNPSSSNSSIASIRTSGSSSTIKTVPARSVMLGDQTIILHSIEVVSATYGSHVRYPVSRRGRDAGLLDRWAQDRRS
jgi:hypothetical protein